MIEVSKFPLICRYCLAETDKLNEISNVESCTIFYNITKFKVDSYLPQKVCIECQSKFQEFASFIQTAKENIEHLKTSYLASLDDDEVTKRVKSLENVCPKCHKNFNTSKHLNSHMRSHAKVGTFHCGKCEKTFKFPQNLRRHIQNHLGIKRYKCEECGKAFTRSYALNQHKNVHTGDSPYVCDYCGKMFKWYANHYIHVYRHKLLNGEVNQPELRKKYLQLECEICKKVLASRKALENHAGLHRGEAREKTFLCTECGKGFSSSGHLQTHSRVHTGDTPFECTECDKKFKYLSAFNNHRLVHSGEKPHQCNLCNRLFTQAVHLRTHMRVHSGEKPYSCTFCDKKFASNGNLKVHTRTHTGEKPYECEICGNGYFNSTSLKKHTKTHYKN